MVPRAGFEPAALGLEVLCSILLSYRGMELIIANPICLRLFLLGFANGTKVGVVKAFGMLESVPKRAVDKYVK